MAYDEIERIALRDVYLDKLKLPGVSSDFHLRRIFREYSRKFHTPLHVVYELPLDFVFQAWLEEYYEDQDVEVLRREAVQMTKDPAVLAEERKREDERDADDHLFIVEERKIQAAMKSMEAAVQKFKKEAAVWLPRDADSEIVSGPPPPPKPAEEQITMKFEDVDFDADSFGPFEPPPPKTEPPK